MTMPIPETSPDFDRTRIIERPDGFYWQDKESGAEFGPFATLVEAARDMEFNADAASQESGDSVEEAEEALGISDWIDTDTGLPAEDSVPRIEDH